MKPVKTVDPGRYLTPTQNMNIRQTMAENILDNLREVNGKFYANIPVSLMATRSYQRIICANVYRIRDEWNDRRCGFLTVCYDKVKCCFFVIDGEHRACAARMKGIKSLPCRVFTDLDESKQALIFVRQMDGRSKLKAIDTFRANQYVAQEDDFFLSQTDKIIKEVCDRYGITVSDSCAANTLRTIPTVRSIIKVNGDICLDYILSTICKAHWNEYAEAFSAEMLRALAIFYKYTDSDRRNYQERLVATISTTTPKDIMAEAKVKHPGFAGYDTLLAELFKDIINGER